MVAYAVQNAPHAGVQLTETQPATGSFTGNTAPCGNGIGLLVKNGSGGSVNVTIAVPAVKTFDGLAISGGGRTVAVAAGQDQLIPLVDATYTDPATGLCAFGVSANTTVLAAVIAIGA